MTLTALIYWDNFVSVTFAMAATEFAEASQVVKIISGEIEPP
jgi:hypothetical protein